MASRAVPSAPAPVIESKVSTKPDEDDRIGPVGTAYTPIKLQPKRLVNPFAARQAQTQADDAVQSKPSPNGAPQSPLTLTCNLPPLTAGKKLTWSERQALAKKQAEEEDSRSRAASFNAPPVAPVRSFGGPSPAAEAPPPAPPVISGTRSFGSPAAAAIPPPPPPPVPVAQEEEEEEEEEYVPVSPVSSSTVHCIFMIIVASTSATSARFNASCHGSLHTRAGRGCFSTSTSSPTSTAASASCRPFYA